MDTHSLQRRTVAHLPTALVAVFAGSGAVAGSFAVAGRTQGWVVAPVTAVLARQTPDVVVRYAITVLGSLGQQLALLGAVATVVGAVAALTATGVHLGRRLNNRALPVVAAGVGSWVLAALLTHNLVLAFGAGLPAAGVVLIATAAGRLDVGGGLSPARRRVLGSGVTAMALGVVGAVVGSRRTPDRQSLGGAPNGTDAETTDGSDGEPTRRERYLAAAREQSLGVEGLEPLVSGRFYQVDINAVNPAVEASSWTLSVTGAVEEEVTMDYEDLRGRPWLDRFETLRCVGEGLNGHKMDTALWTGVPIRSLVAAAGPESGCECVMLRAADGYFEEFPMAALEGGLVAYGMNGRALPRAHGYPARALIPGHWGEINVKWLTEIEVLDRAATGYWEQRGWHGTGPVTTVAKIHAVNNLPDGRQELGGHAYAGTRGVRTVEVSTDGGATWERADLSAPLADVTGHGGYGPADVAPVDDTWRQWRHTYDPPDGAHEVVARAIDGTGQLQPREESGPFPNGPSGWVTRTVE
ncbi:MAG: molybdopterin-dependent oxidoreductase [Halorientalis sp.]